MYVSGLLPGILTSIERRFQLTSQQLGLLVSSYDIVSIILVLFVSYVGGRGHKIRWVSNGVLILAISAVIFAVPHFATEEYSYVGEDDSLVCMANGTGGDDTCTATESASYLSRYYYVFVVSAVLAAIGALPIYTLGIAAIDESVSNDSYGIYMGMFLYVNFLMKTLIN